MRIAAGARTLVRPAGVIGCPRVRRRILTLAAMPLPGWTRLGGKAERYRDPRGREVSRRQYENARAKAAGWNSWSEYQRAARSSEYNRARTEVIIERGESKRTTGMGSELGRRFARMRKARDTEPPNLYDPDGPLAEYLVYIGRRKPEWEFDVGDTPQVQSKQPA